MAAAKRSLMARKKRASASANAYFATTNPELQITIKNQGAAPTNFFMGALINYSLVRRD
jgi:hypothetical protein